MTGNNDEDIIIDSRGVIYTYTVNDETTVFVDFQQTMKVFPTNFIKQNRKSFSYIMIKFNKPRNFYPA